MILKWNGYTIRRMELFSLVFSLFILMDPIGNLPVYVSILSEIEPKRQKIIIFRELLIALFVMIVFMYIGETLLDILKVNKATVAISGGIILFLIALKMVFPVKTTEVIYEKEPLIVPLAIPLIAGPATLAAIMIYSHKTEQLGTLFLAITLAWVASLVILLLAPTLKRMLGERGILALERLMGLILTLMSVQMFLEGIQAFLYAKH